MTALTRDLEVLYRERDDIDAQLAACADDETHDRLHDERTRIQWAIEDAETILGAREAARDRRAAMRRFL